MFPRTCSARLVRVGLVIGIVFSASATVPAQGLVPRSDADSVTARDPSIPEDELAILLEPLTQEELQREAEAWVVRIREMVEEIGRKKLLAKRLKRASEATSELADARERVKTAAEEAQEATRAATEAGTPEARAQAEAKDEALREAREEQARLEEELAAVERATAERIPEADQLLPPAPEPGETPPADEIEAARQRAERLTAGQLALVKEVTELGPKREERIKRAQLVLDEWKAKGGDVTNYETYLSSVSSSVPAVEDVSNLREIWVAGKTWLLSPDGGVELGLNLLKGIAIIIAFWILARILGNIVDRVLGRLKKFSLLLKNLVRNSVRKLVIIVGVVVGLTAMGLDMTPILALIGAAGLVIGLALQGTLGNFASGFLILVYRPFDVGDAVEVAGVSGNVEATNLLTTNIRTFDNKLVIVQNNSIWGGTIVNATGRSKRRRVDMVFGIGYSDDIDRAHEVLTELVTRHPHVLADPAPNIRVHELADSSVNFIVRPWCKTAHYWEVYWDLTRQVKERFDAEGISIPFPQRDVHFYQESPPVAAGSTESPSEPARFDRRGGVSV